MASRAAAENPTEQEEESRNHHHPYAFHVSGPRKISSPNWRDLINSSWKDANYRRTVIACFIQAVYLLELDRQENRTEDTSLAPNWWKPFKYKLVKTLIDDRDGSIYGAILEWDRPAAMADLILIRPNDLRFLAWESLKGSSRFGGAMEALKSTVERCGSSNVCIAGHSLGAGFALQVGKEMAKQGVFVETHLFNPPSVSLAMSLRSIGEKAGFAWRRFKSMIPSREAQANDEETLSASTQTNSYSKEMKKWIPHLYVNNSDYICCNYNDSSEAADHKTSVTSSNASGKENADPAIWQAPAKLFVLSKGKQKFLEAHGLEQWWSDDLELQLAVNNSKLISHQLKSLYSAPPTLPQPPLKLQ
ncbi:hypothetical protein Syun_028099 [Stephania yunnanensis]|uniref:Uncharacterized protein n=1 Tax=Stephania yunnanensis TaxID=152371 RepID=A0AAP0EP18_9MAGN